MDGSQQTIGEYGTSELDYGTNRLESILLRGKLSYDEAQRGVEALRVSHELAYNDVWRKSGHPYVKHPFSILEMYINDGFTTYIPAVLGHDVPEEAIRRFRKQTQKLTQIGKDFGLNMKDNTSLVTNFLDSKKGHDALVENVISEMSERGCFTDYELDIIRAFTPIPGNSKMQNYQRLASFAKQTKNVAPLVMKIYDMTENVSDIENVGDSNLCSYVKRAKKIRGFLENIMPNGDLSRQAELVGYTKKGDFREVLYQRLDHISNVAKDEIKRRNLF